MTENSSDNISMVDIRRLEEQLGQLRGQMNELSGSVRAIGELVGPLKTMLNWWLQEQIRQEQHREWREAHETSLKELRNTVTTLKEEIEQAKTAIGVFKWMTGLAGGSSAIALISAFRDLFSGK